MIFDEPDIGIFEGGSDSLAQETTRRSKVIQTRQAEIESRQSELTEKKDVFKPNTSEVISDSTDGIACWLIDTDHNDESFFIRHTCFPGSF